MTRARSASGARLARQARSDGVAQGGQPRIFGCQRGIGGKPSLDIQSARRIEFAVECSIEEKRRIILERALGHAGLPSLSTSCARARASLDITVPCGAPVAAAISR